MKKYLMYWSIFVVVCAAIFTWWWTRPSNYIDRIVALNVPSSDALFSKTDGSEEVYLLKVGSPYVQKVKDGCELHGGSFASADQTRATRFNSDAGFKAKGLFATDHIGCLIKGKGEKGAWEFYIKDDLLYFDLKSD